MATSYLSSSAASSSMASIESRAMSRSGVLGLTWRELSERASRMVAITSSLIGHGSAVQPGEVASPGFGAEQPREHLATRRFSLAKGRIDLVLSVRLRVRIQLALDPVDVPSLISHHLLQHASNRRVETRELGVAPVQVEHTQLEDARETQDLEHAAGQAEDLAHLTLVGACRALRRGAQ